MEGKIYDINGIPVIFPFQPYEVQENYMKKVIDCLKNKRHGILESPTGTGKTLSLLCATLGWISTQKEKQAKWKTWLPDSESEEEVQNNEADVIHSSMSTKGNTEQMSNGLNKVSSGSNNSIPMETIPKVIYASRTHTQISQAMKELKRSGYRHMKSAVVASRAQLCINPDLKQKPNSEKIRKCRILRKNNECKYYTNVDRSLNEDDFKEPILDIEDLGKFGEKFQCCPYYASRKLMQNAEVVFLPYNYLLDPKIRSANQINLKDAIIILDEAHNVEKVCEDTACTTIKSSEICTAISDLKYVLDHLDGSEPRKYENKEDDKDKNLSREDVRKVMESLQKFETEISNLSVPISEENSYGNFMFSLFEKAQITNQNCQKYIDLVNKSIEFTIDQSACDRRRREGKGLQKMLEFLRIVFSNSSECLRDKLKDCFRVHLEEDSKNETVDSKIINFWCFSPAFGIKHLFQQEIRSLILTSGTLAPLDPLISEMEIPNPLQLSNPHTIKNSQILVKIVGSGVDGERFDTQSKNRKNEKCLRSIGNSIVELSSNEVVPDGMLIFFASYPVMEICMEFWKRNGIWSKIEEHKPICVETKGNDQFKETMNKYYNHIDNKEGAIFMAVLRGKVSEGLDFADMYGRAVLIVGIPFAPIKDLKVLLKKEYLRKRKQHNRKTLSGADWYQLDAIRAVNQAIGRVIRHKDDYGAILLCDDRYNNNQTNISTWVRDKLNQQQPKDFSSTITELKTFFRECEQTLPKPIPKANREKYISDDDDGDDDDDTPYLSTSFEPNRHNVEPDSDEDGYDENDGFVNDEPISDQYDLSSSSEGLDIKLSRRSKRISRRQIESQSNSQPSSESSGHSSRSSSRKSRSQSSNESSNESISQSSGQSDVPPKRLRKRKREMTKKASTERLSRHSTSQSSEYNTSDNEPLVKSKRAKNSSKFKRIIIASDSDSSQNEEPQNPMMKLLKNNLGCTAYKKVAQAISSYKNDDYYIKYRDSLIEIFKDATLPKCMLSGMTMFFKSDHRPDFDAYVEQLETE